MKTSISAIAAACLLCSCGFMTPAQQYAGDKQAETDIAVLQGYVANPFGDEYHTTIIGYTKMETTGPGEHKKFGLHGFTDYPKEIQVLPGEYDVQVYCFKELTSYRPSTTLSLRAGQTYLLKCRVREGEALITVNGQRMG
jgi:hypothetical protein